MIGRLCIVCEVLPTALCILHLQSRGAARAIGPVDDQASR